MDYSSADMVCDLKINSTECKGCKMKVIQILQSIPGMRSITVDGEEGTVKVKGRVNPRTFLKVLKNQRKHAEIKNLKFDGEVVVERSLGYYGGEYGNAPCDCSQRYSSYSQMPYPYNYQHYSQSLPPLLPPLPPPPPPYLYALPLPQFQPQPSYPNNHFGPPPLPPTYWCPPPPPPSYNPPPPPAPPEEPKQSKDGCAIM